MLDKQRHWRALTLVSTTALIAAMSGTAHAQSAVAQDAQTSPQATTSARQPQHLEDIVVTAERRPQNLQDVAISATVLNGSDLDRRGVHDVTDLQSVAPSVSINTYNRQTFINIRGVGENRSAPTTSPGVAYYLDGVLIPDDKFIGMSFYDIDSIEVLRGPQGTLSGQNSTGGAIYVRTPDPAFDTIGGYGDVTVSSYDGVKTVGAINVGGSDVALRIAGVHDQRDSFTKNIGGSPSQPGNNNVDAIRATLRLRSADHRLMAHARGEYFDSRNDGNAVKRRSDQISDDPFVIEEDAISKTRQVGYRLSSDVQYDVTSGIQARGLIAWQSATTTDQTDGDRTSTALPVPPGLPATGANTALYTGRVSNTSTAIDTLVSEINILSSGKGPFKWVAGGFLLDQHVGLELGRDNYHTTDFVSSNSTIATDSRNNSKSLFAQASYFVTSRLEATVGARHSWDRQIVDRLAVPGPGPLPNRGVAKSREWTGKAGLNYHLGRNLIYVTASKGYKAGGTNLTPNSANFGPETNYVYEFGGKTEFLDRHVRINGDIFYSDYRNIQFASLAGGLPLTQNAGRGKSWGAELEAAVQYGGFLATAGAGYLDGTFARDACLNDTNSAITSADCPAGNREVKKGSVLPYSPKWTINAGVQYEIGLTDDFSVTPRLQWSHVGEQLTTPFPSVATYLPGHDVFDARITMDIMRKYKIEGFVSNFTNKIYISSQIQDSSSAEGGYIYGAPRQYGIRLMAKF
jgi:iron complex outermembrane receptor protein